MSVRRPASTRGLATTRSRRAGSLLSDRTRKALVDRMMDEYVNWREECLGVSAAYARWCQAPPGDHRLAYHAYVAAVDREQRAATIYSELVERFAAASLC